LSFAVNDKALPARLPDTVHSEPPSTSPDRIVQLPVVVNERNTRHRTMVFTTYKHPKRWGDVLHDDDLAEAIVDRILERSPSTSRWLRSPRGVEPRHGCPQWVALAD
jgi:hypothetical protein